MLLDDTIAVIMLLIAASAGSSVGSSRVVSRKRAEFIVIHAALRHVRTHRSRIRGRRRVAVVIGIRLLLLLLLLDGHVHGRHRRQFVTLRRVMVMRFVRTGIAADVRRRVFWRQAFAICQSEMNDCYFVEFSPKWLHRKHERDQHFESNSTT